MNARNEAETRAELIDPQLHKAGWGADEHSQVRREVLTPGRLLGSGGRRAKREIADYVLLFRNHKLAVVEAKAESAPVTEGLAQAKSQAAKLQTRFAFATNGRGIYQADMHSGAEDEITHFPTPQQLWQAAYGEEEARANYWRRQFAATPDYDKGGNWQARYYQHIAITKTLEAVARGQQRILLTLATGAGKTAIACQVAWKLHQSRWNLQSRQGALQAEPVQADGTAARRPRILFLADRNILADQAFNEFSAFAEDARVRIRPKDFHKTGGARTNGSVFFTIYQTFMAGDAGGITEHIYGDYPPDYFDFIIVDECHRGGANDESKWRGILEYFAPAVQLGLTATPKRSDNADTYRYFGEPVYRYSLRQGVNDGYLTPFRVKQIATTLDDYRHVPDDDVVEGEIDPHKLYIEDDFNRNIVIDAREKKRVELFMREMDQRQKTLVFCANQAHAALVRDLVNQCKNSTDPEYCVRVTAKDGAAGDDFLRTFRDNEKAIPTVLTTSRKLSTGVDARNVRNIVLMRKVRTVIEFKQIIGRGTRLFDGKDYFTVYDFVRAYEHFSDPEWDGDPENIAREACVVCGEDPCTCPKAPPRPKEPCPQCGQNPCTCEKQEMIVVKLGDGREREIQSMMVTSFWGPKGEQITAAQFVRELFGALLPDLFRNEDELRRLWSQPQTRRQLLKNLEQKGYGDSQLQELQGIVNAENSDLYDVLAWVAFARPPITRAQRVEAQRPRITAGREQAQQQFLDFVLRQYIGQGYEELDDEKLPELLELKYASVHDAADALGGNEEIRALFLDFQRQLYAP